MTLERIIWELRDAAEDGDEPTFHVGVQLRNWADRLAALAGAGPYGWIEPETDNFVSHADKVEMPFDASTYTVPVWTHAPAKAREDDGLDEELLRIARWAEMLKRDCGMDPESPQAIRNGQYMNISLALRRIVDRRAALATFAEGA